MKGTTILCLLFSGFCSFTYSSSEFHFVNIPKKYPEAKSFCREMYTDLATVRNSADMDSLIALVPQNLNRAWIGLEMGEERMWHWSRPDQELDFFHWKAGEPQNNNKDTCAAMNSDGEWFESRCGTRRRFVCDGGNSTAGPIFFGEIIKSWRRAQDDCRKKSSDLVSVHSTEENEAVQNVSRSQTVWIGLFRDAWKWSDGSNSSFRYWKSNQPNNLANQDCVAAEFKNKGQWNDLRCDVKRKFICHGARKPLVSPTTTKQTSTQQAVTTVHMLTTRTVLSNSPSQEVITSTFQTTTVLTSTEQSNTVHVTTTQAITSNSMDQNATSPFELTTLNTTEPVSSQNSSTGLNNVTTETVTTYPPPTTTMQITRDDISLSTTLDRTSPDTTESSTLMPSGNNEGLTPDKFILIRDNLTWNEAVSYCREHYVDLVSVTSEEIHKWVAEKAKNATSSHVWLGLRYTCGFNFWFWIRSVTGCYQNWAPGQGPERQYGCGVTGAIETTGGQQWAGVPETDKLNFICYTC